MDWNAFDKKLMAEWNAATGDNWGEDADESPHLPFRGRSLAPPLMSLATMITLEVGYQISQDFDRTHSMDRTEWLDYIMERVNIEELVEAIDQFLKDKWMVELDQLVILEIAYQTLVQVNDAVGLPGISRELFSHWCCETGRTRTDLVNLIIEQPKVTGVH